MQVRDETPTGLTSEIKIVPTWAWALAGVVFFIAQFFFNVGGFGTRTRRYWRDLCLGSRSAWWRVLCIFYRRQKRTRTAHEPLWTIVAVFIPNALGIILYFVLRQPLRSACPHCGNAVQPGFNFCPRCSYKLSPSCLQCQRVVGVNDVYCPYCGTPIRNQAPPDSGSSTKLPG
jgi:RNA polymerase subunit RPABC4/transcription elongation factor Spt4